MSPAGASGFWPSLELLERSQWPELARADDTCDHCGKRTTGERVVRDREGRFGHAYCLLGYNV